MKIGLVSVDGHGGYPNLALMKISAFHKEMGDSVEWASPMFGEYDVLYQSKIFSFTPDDHSIYRADNIIKGGTGYEYTMNLPSYIDSMQPDYSIYPIDRHTAYGFLTRGCPNRCKWCIVPNREGDIHPYMDVDEIAVDGRRNLILMDNNILASEYGIRQIEKIAAKGYAVDFNQGLDARLVDKAIAKLLSKVRWLTKIRFGCDTPRQIIEVQKAMMLIDSFSTNPKSYFLYTIINDDIDESYKRLSFFRNYPRVFIHGQPYRDPNDAHQIIPQWQKDMAHWANRKELYKSTDFKAFSPRKGFMCDEYFQ